MRRIHLVVALLLLTLILLPEHAHAQPASAQTIDAILTRFRAAMAGWGGPLQTIARATFAGLALIQLFWALARQIFRRADLSEVLAELVNQIMFIGLFFWLLTTTTAWGPAIIKGFLTAAAQTGAAPMTPGLVFAAGIDMGSQALTQDIDLFSIGASIGLILVGIALTICFAWIAAMMVIALVQSYFILNGAVIFMMFGASVWTKDIAVSVIRSVLGIGAKLFALQLLTSIGMAFVTDWGTAAGVPGTATIQSMVIQLGCGVVLLAIVQSIPAELERMIGGSSLAGGGALVGAAAEIAGAAAIMSRAATSLATSVAGAGALTGSAAALAQSQMAARVAAGNSPRNERRTSSCHAGRYGAQRRIRCRHRCRPPPKWPRHTLRLRPVPSGG
jgi:type IV secretion system protein TrbL